MSRVYGAVGGGMNTSPSLPQPVITPGQAAVLYDAASGEQVLGGGLIE